MRRWLELEASISCDLADPLSCFLFDLGSSGVEMEEAGRSVTLRAYFPEGAVGRQHLVKAVQRYLRSLGPGNDGVTVRYLREQNWEQSWKDWFTPLAAGERLWIKPPWVTETPAGRIPLVIDPGMAFGTGHHPSTLGCLELIERAIAEAPIEKALDLGTGSGILAIALAKLGARVVYAVDIDRDALATARVNAARNGVAELIEVQDTWGAAGSAYHCIVANLYSSALQEFAPQICSHLDPLGSFICAGFIAADELSICNIYARLGLFLRQRWERENWVALWFRKTNE